MHRIAEGERMRREGLQKRWIAGEEWSEAEWTTTG